MKTKKRQIANSGDFFSRVKENVNNGWTYPANVIVTSHYPMGRWGNGTGYYLFDGKEFHVIGHLPSWAGDTERSSYFSTRKRIREAASKANGSCRIQSFIKCRV